MPHAVPSRRLLGGLLLLALLVPAATSSGQGGITQATPEEIQRNLARRESEWRKWQESHSTERKRGWQVKRRRRVVLVVSDGISGSGNVGHIANMASSMCKWLDATFGDVSRSKGGKPVIRVCADDNEVSPWLSGAEGRFVWRMGEVVVVHRIGVGLLDVFGNLGDGLLRQALDAEGPALMPALPDWLAAGLPMHARRASLSKKLGFFFRAPRDSWQTAVELLRQGTMIPAQALIGTPHAELQQMRRNSAHDCRACSELLVRYLTFGDGRKGKTRGCIEKQLGAMQAELRKLELSEWSKVMKAEAEAPKRPELDVRLRAFQDYWQRVRDWRRLPQEERKRIQEVAYKAAWGDWEAEDWRRLDAELEAFVKSGLR